MTPPSVDALFRRILGSRRLPLPSLRFWLRTLLDSGLRRTDQGQRRRFREFENRFGSVLRPPLRNGGPKGRISLVQALALPPFIPEFELIKGMQLAGFEPTVLLWFDPWLARTYALTGAKVIFWNDFLQPPETSAVERAFSRVGAFEDLMRVEHEGARIGRFAASMTLRSLRLGSLDLTRADVRRRLLDSLARGIAYASAAHRIVRHLKPDLALFVDRGYSPQGELFDVCLSAGVDCLNWNAGHKPNTLTVKRYSPANRDEHPVSISHETWERLRRMPWTESHRDGVRKELHDTYASGDWRCEGGTQFHKRIVEPGELRRRLGLDPAKKTAVIFPHILYDATFFWGQDLFRTYEEWLVEATRAACANDRVNWIIKIHPANVVKDAREGVRGEHAELVAIRKHVGSLPPHIYLVPADSDVNTYSFFGLMDYCLTVRGTIGIEAPVFGIPVLTAGTGRYDRRGFTIDSDTTQEYLNRLAHIQDIEPLSPMQRESAERFAYGVFLLRPFRLTSVALEYERDARATAKTAIHVGTKEEWQKASDLTALARWIADREAIDYLGNAP